jgi:hypothetical protein
MADGQEVTETLDPRVVEDLGYIKDYYDRHKVKHPSPFTWDQLRPRIIVRLNRRYGVGNG